MRIRWADPVYRLQFGSAGCTLTTAELTLGAINVTAKELLEKINEIHAAYVGDKQVLPKTLPRVGTEARKGSQEKGERK